jgi:quercetin dioxygenase-like cupin family protein
MVKSGDEITNPRTGQRMRFLKTSADTNGELLQIDCFNPPSGVKEPEHIHPYQENRFDVRSGMLSISIAGAERQARAGEVISIPAGVPHYFWNAGPEDATYIQEFRPALRIEVFFETLFALARNGQLNAQGMPSLLQMAVFVPSFWSEIRVTRPPQLVQQAMFTLLGPVSRTLGYRGA